MDDLELLNITAALYDELINKVIAKQPLSVRESSAFYALDFQLRLETGGLDGIIGDSQPYAEALRAVRLIAHAHSLDVMMQRFPNIEGDNSAHDDREAWEGREQALLAMSDTHLNGDAMIFDRAVYAF